ncbi:MAG: ATP synthase F1 subunit delta [Lachnospiraceae bacterium]|nr:ATP synthase F1 subunit delta [Lachnospiraceae bacterium]
MAKLVSRVYGEALYEAAGEQGKLTEIMDEIKAYKEIMDKNPDFDKLMSHPGVPKMDKLEVMKNVFNGRVDNILAGFLETVIDKERYRDLDSIFEYYIAKVKESEGIGIAYVASAVEMNDSQKANVMKKLLETTKYKSFEMHYEVDPALIGGMTIKVGDRVVDSSVRNKLDALTKELLGIQLG